MLCKAREKENQSILFVQHTSLVPRIISILLGVFYKMVISAEVEFR